MHQSPPTTTTNAGAHEGAYAWLTLNYLLNKLGGGPEATVAAIDLGGGSVQEAFALPATDAASAPAGYVTTLRAGGNSYSVYVHRWVWFGLVWWVKRVLRCCLYRFALEEKGRQ